MSPGPIEHAIAALIAWLCVVTTFGALYNLHRLATSDRQLPDVVREMGMCFILAALSAFTAGWLA